jgi:hypothetical protein
MSVVMIHIAYIWCWWGVSRPCPISAQPLPIQQSWLRPQLIGSRLVAHKNSSVILIQHVFCLCVSTFWTELRITFYFWVQNIILFVYACIRWQCVLDLWQQDICAKMAFVCMILGIFAYSPAKKRAGHELSSFWACVSLNVIVNVREHSVPIDVRVRQDDLFSSLSWYLSSIVYGLCEKC